MQGNAPTSELQTMKMLALTVLHDAGTGTFQRYAHYVTAPTADGLRAGVPDDPN